MLSPGKPVSRESELRDKTRNERQKTKLLREVALTRHSPSADRLLEQSADLCQQSQKLLAKSRDLMAKHRKQGRRA